MTRVELTKDVCRGTTYALFVRPDRCILGVAPQDSPDAEQFAERKIPRITIHSLAQDAWNAHILHTSKDKGSMIRLDDYYQTYRLLAAYVVSLDQAGDPSPAHVH